MKFDAFATQFGILTPYDGLGMPQMGQMMFAIEVVVDAHDDKNLPFSTLKKLYDMAHNVTRDKVKNMKIEFWADEDKQSAISTFSFKGWISSFFMLGGGDQNHVVALKLQPALDKNQFADIQHGN